MVTIDGTATELSREAARRLRRAIGEALVDRHEFVRTVGTRRADGRYEVARRGADSGGNAKVFEDFAALEELFARLPDRFAAEDVGRVGISGSRRHLLVWHLTEHPAFACEVDGRNPLAAVKSGPTDGDRARGPRDVAAEGPETD